MPKGLTLRAVLLEGVVWFLGADACRVLELSQPHVAYKRRAPDEITYRDRTTVGLPPDRAVVLGTSQNRL